MKIHRRKQRLLAVVLGVALLASLGLQGASGLTWLDQEMLVNGNFEGGFTYIPGCGTVGNGWSCFTNGGTVSYGFYDDQWQPVVADGLNSQLIELSTMQNAASEADRYAGIYQSVRLVRGATYQLSLKGLMRERDPLPNDDPFRYRVQWGYTTDGSTDWTTVNNWVELYWNKIDNRTAPTALESYKVDWVAPSDQATLFFRVWKKWGTAYKELDVNLDAISLYGPAVRGPAEPAGPIVILPGPVTPGPVVEPPLICDGANYIANGNFEGGFANGVGNNWAKFTNGGAASYGFYDEMWPKVIKDGANGQLIEINTYGLAAADPDRYAGIYQVVGGLTPGATYEFSLYGMLREEAAHPAEDAFRYRVQWGYAPASASPSEAAISSWTELPWDTIYLRTEPGDMSFYGVRFQAPSDKIVLAIRSWKKWGTIGRELDVNLDAIKLVRCGGMRPCCVHIVAPGESLSLIAARYHTTMAHLAEVNHIANPNVIHVGQRLEVPCDGAQPPDVNDHQVVQPPTDPPECITVHVVARGNTLYKIANMYNTTVARIVERNRLANPNLIYVGQKICIVGP
jgi:LysM repeat protein